MRCRSLILPVAALAACVVPVAAQEQFPGYVWDFNAIDGDAFLAVIPLSEVGLEAGEPDIPFMLTCTPNREWTIYVRDAEPEALAAAIVGGDMVKFDIVRVGPRGRMDEYPPQYYPSLHSNQMYGTWDYSAIWSASDGLLDQLAGAESLAIDGTGVAMILPPDRYRQELVAFTTACNAIAAGAGGP